MTPKENQVKSDPKHIPVLAKEVLQYLQPQAGQSYLDVTAGYGGHAALVLAATKAANKAVLVDRDVQASDYLHSQFKDAKIIHLDFLAASQDLAEQGERFDMILADLGVSSPHLDQAHRGFSFSHDGPLDMRMDQSGGTTAQQLVNTLPQTRLMQILRTYGEEPGAAKIAARIVDARPLSSTAELAAVIAGRRPRQGKIHPATKSFQALRIAVNGELEQLEQSLPLWQQLLETGGRLVVISFHSLEDRVVKQYLSDHAGNRYDSELTLLTKKPVSASPDEIVLNPRARSAKLRAAVKK